MASTRPVYWDTSCFICFLNKSELDRRKICEDVLRHAQLGAITLHTSVWTIAETVRPKAKSLPGARPLTANEIVAIGAVFRWSWITKHDVDQRVAFKAVELSRDFNLSPADAVHAATAIVWRCHVLQRWDRDFDRIKHLIPVESPAMMTAAQSQADMASVEGSFGPQRLGPHPDDFEEPTSP